MLCACHALCILSTSHLQVRIIFLLIQKHAKNLTYLLTMWWMMLIKWDPMFGLPPQGIHYDKRSTEDAMQFFLPYNMGTCCPKLWHYHHRFWLVSGRRAQRLLHSSFTEWCMCFLLTATARPCTISFLQPRHGLWYLLLLPHVWVHFIPKRGRPLPIWIICCNSIPS
jgi:hypothetical protein